MTKFIAQVVQKYDGCDYSISCGETVWRLESTTKDEALAELRGKIIGEYDPERSRYDDGYWDERIIGEVVLFAVADETEAPVRLWYTEATEHAAQADVQAKDDLERLEYDRLKAKFGGLEKE